MIEFTLNSSINSSTGFTPFELNCGHMPQITPFPTEDIIYPGVKVFTQKAHANLAMAHDTIIEACISMTYHANWHHSEEKPYDIDDLIYLSTVNLNLPKQRTQKLAPKYIGPFCVVKSYPGTSTYELELSAKLAAQQIHPVFHVSLLWPFEPNDDSLFPSHESKHFHNFGMPDDDEWLVNKIVGHHFVDNYIEFNI